MNIKTYGEYKYLYETHLHTRLGSACAANSGYEMAKSAKEYGYAGIIVTEHNWGGNTAVSRTLSWNEWIDAFVKGYEEAKAYGDNHDLDVFWGYEAGFDGTEFLVYGITPQWLKEHPEIKDTTIKKHCEMIHLAGGFIIHAHPYRREWYIPEIRLFPQYVDGVEGVNATHSSPKSKSHNDPAFDQQAIFYAQKYNFPITAGSDIHTTDLLGGGVLFKKRIRSIQDFISEIKSGDYLLTNGDKIYDCHGRLMTL